MQIKLQNFCIIEHFGYLQNENPLINIRQWVHYTSVMAAELCGYCPVIVRLLSGYCAVIVRCGHVIDRES